jgi:Raf kinase inhibitor-like YbhB/YbcL family protein
MLNKLKLTALLSSIVFGSFAVALSAQRSEAGHTFVLESSTVKAGAPIPPLYTQHGPGRDISPPLAWKDVPKGTKGLALILDGPAYGVRRDPFVHWVVYNIPPAVTGLPEALPMEARLDSPNELRGLMQGPTGWRTPGYRGPLPGADVGNKPQLFRFTLYALDAPLDLKPGLDKTALLNAIKGHVIATAEMEVTCPER